MAVSEYDAFGPWIYEIDEEHPAPRLFAPHIPSNEAALMLFKIPRNIERRAATPDMDLYDYVVGAYPNHICVLKREGYSVIKTALSHTEIEGVSVERHFLAGILRLYLKNGEVMVPFNAISMDMIKRLTTFIRNRALNGSSVVPADVRENQADLSLNLFFTNMLKDLREDGEDPLLYAYQPVAERIPVSKAGWQGAFNRFRHQTIPATLHVLTPDELIIIKQDTAAGKREAFVYQHFYLPITGIKAIGMAENTDYVEQICSIALSHHSLSYTVKEENQSIQSLYGLMKTLIK